MLKNLVAAREADDIGGYAEAAIKVKLGEGVIKETYSLAEGMANFGGKVTMAFCTIQAAFYLKHLPQQDEIPGNYFQCGFNRFAQTTFGLAEISGASAALTKNVQGIGNIALGFWLGYVGFLGLVATTVDDFAASQVPPQPADGRCDLPVSR